jgi:acyl-CoA synthetase (NDP forming)
MVAAQIVETVRGRSKPVLMSWLVARSLAAKGMARITDAKIPLYDMPERVVRGLAALTDWQSLGVEA